MKDCGSHFLNFELLNEWPTTNDERRTTNDERRTTNDGRRTTNRRRTTNDKETTVTNAVDDDSNIAHSLTNSNSISRSRDFSFALTDFHGA